MYNDILVFRPVKSSLKYSPGEEKRESWENFVVILVVE